MKAGVFAGGGSFGAYTVGVLSKRQPRYDITYGCSTGSLIAPFAVLGDWDVLKQNYTSVTSDKIFKVNPFFKSGFPNIFVIIKRLIFNKTLGDTSRLRELIKDTFTIEHYNRILALEKDVCIVVTSVTDKSEPCKYIYLSKTSYEDFCFYMWASTCVPAFTSIAVKDNCEYVDGGVTDVIPLYKALDDGCDNIDVYCYDEPEESRYRTETKNTFHLVARCYNIMRYVIYNAGFVNAYLETKNNTNIKIKRIHPPYKLAENALVFDKKLMLEWYKLGYNS